MSKLRPAPLVVLMAIAFGISTATAQHIGFRLGGDSSKHFLANPNEFPVCKKHISLMHFDGKPAPEKRALFDTNKAIIEIGAYGKGARFTGKRVLSRLKSYEACGWDVFGIFVYREDWLGKNGTGGPFSIDRRILSQQDIDNIKSAIKKSNLKCKNSLKIIQLLGGRVKGQRGNTFLKMDARMKEYLKQFDGIGTECHIRDNLREEGRTTLRAMAAMAKWAELNNKLALVFMGGGPRTYKDLPKAQATYQYLWKEMDKVGVKRNAAHLIYFRQGAWDGGKTAFLPETSKTTITHQQKWLIEQLKGGSQ